jgi:hypothetical protein
MRLLVASLSLVAVSWVAVPTARAEAPGSGPPLPGAEPADPSPVFIAEVKPLLLMVGTLSTRVEAVVAGHVAIGLDVHGTYDSGTYQPSSDNDYMTVTNTTKGVGGEIGLRYYGNRLRFGRANGFVGTSVLYGRYSNEVSPYATEQTGPTVVDFAQWGFAIDTGIIYVGRAGFTVAAGGGLQVTRVSNSPSFGLGGGPLGDPAEMIVFGGGLRPRLLVAFGWSL